MRTRVLYGMLALLAAGCTPRLIAARTTARVMERGLPALYAESDPLLAEQAMASQLKLLEVFLANDPDNPRLLRLSAQGFSGYAFLFLEGKDDARAQALYGRGRDYGLRALRRSAGCDLGAENDAARLSACLARLGRRDAETLFWTAYAWAGMDKLSLDSPDAVADLAKVERLMLRVEALATGFFYGGPDLFLGSYYGGRSRTLGGDPAKARAHFEKALAAGGGRFLTAAVLYARYYAVQAQDRPLFHELLSKVAATPAEVLPEQRLANAVAIRKAKELLKKEDELFE